MNARSVFVHAGNSEQAVIAGRLAVIAQGLHPTMSPLHIEPPIKGDDEYEVLFGLVHIPESRHVGYDQNGRRYGNAGTGAF